MYDKLKFIFIKTVFHSCNHLESLLSNTFYRKIKYYDNVYRSKQSVLCFVKKILLAHWFKYLSEVIRSGQSLLIHSNIVQLHFCHITTRVVMTADNKCACLIAFAITNYTL